MFRQAKRRRLTLDSLNSVAGEIDGKKETTVSPLVTSSDSTSGVSSRGSVTLTPSSISSSSSSSSSATTITPHTRVIDENLESNSKSSKDENTKMNSDDPRAGLDSESERIKPNPRLSSISLSESKPDSQRGSFVETDESEDENTDKNVDQSDLTDKVQKRSHNIQDQNKNLLDPHEPIRNQRHR